MSGPRLTFLYPFLFAPARPTTVREASRTARRAFTSPGRKRQNTAHQRYGSANQPMPHLGGGSEAKDGSGVKPKTKKEAAVDEAIPLPEPSAEAVKEAEKQDRVTTGPSPKAAAGTSSKASTAKSATSTKTAKNADKAPQKEQVQEEEQPAIEALPPTTRVAYSAPLDAAAAIPLAGPSPQPQVQARPLETILDMAGLDDKGDYTAPVYEPTDPAAQSPSPSREKERANTSRENGSQPLETRKPPHISTPPYVHHFDTYGLVRRLEEGGWTQAQAITLMKAVRLTLATNMDLAHHGLVSKSNVENESYLFSAACSELHTEIQTKRKAEGERSRSERTALSHEVDILSQRMTQESATMKDELKGMFDDRKMAVRNEQRDMERKVQELNYKITIHLNSDSRSDVEGVRWIITKRAITALAICVGMILGSIKFASSVAQWEEEEKKQLAASRSRHHHHNGNGNGNGNGHGGGGGGGGPGDYNGDGSPKAEKRDTGVVEEILGGHGEILVQQGDNPAFVSLG